MSQTVRKRIHLIYGIVFSVVTLIAGVCLMAACHGIYSAGLQADAEQIYSREIVAEAFSVIAVPVYLCLALTIGGFILHLALPLERKKAAPEKNRQLILSRLQAKTDLSACDEELRNSILSQRSRRKLLLGISAGISAVCAVIFLVYALNGNNWAPVHEVTGSMIASMKLFVPCTLIPLLCCICTAYACRSSLDREIELMRKAAAQAPGQPAAQAPAKPALPLPLHWIRAVLIAVAILCILCGVLTDGVEGAVSKAIAICTECIGLG